MLDNSNPLCHYDPMVMALTTQETMQSWFLGLPIASIATFPHFPPRHPLEVPAAPGLGPAAPLPPSLFQFKTIQGDLGCSKQTGSTLVH